MSAKEKLAKYFNGKITFPELMGLVICFALIVPFFILAYFDCPSIDDFSFALKKIQLGYWGGQVSAYTQWNGRYFASAILLAHPLAFHSFTLYKLIPVILLSLTIHSIYYFISNCFGMLNKISRFIFSVVIVFCFLNQMPILAQGIYWEPSSITYHLASIMTLYLSTLIIISFSEPGNFSRMKKITGGFLVLAIVGSNETSMLAVWLLLLSFLFYYFITERKINKLLLLYFLLTIAGTIIVVLSPGNLIRGTDLFLPDKHQVWFTIKNSFVQGSEYIFSWLFTKQIAVLSLLTVLAAFIRAKFFESTRSVALIVSLIGIFGYLLLCSLFATGLWSNGLIAPERTINVIYWLFIIIWVALLYFAAIYVMIKFPVQQTPDFRPVFVISLILFLFTITNSDNYYLACEDLLSGKAYMFQKEYFGRIKTMELADDDIEVVFPSYSAFPKTLFVLDDVQENPDNWSNFEFATYFHQGSVRSVHVDPYYTCNYLLDYDAANDKKLDNSDRIT
ncbi:MAG TPA: DUF6056 family protein, partial [Bacteroidia bacterium]|nr:DUF6056 family protein [Bacteroidia bacterium]